ncbi:MAG: hypothetical protein HKN41_04920 [Ilumatobacter sp.]|nr:hypothetical protein [Ilumatobacter sp.]
MKSLAARCLAVLTVATLGLVVYASPSSGPVVTAAPSEGFVATFDTASDFYNRFDYGFSGFDPAANSNPDRIVSWRGDHDRACGAPTTSRTIDVDRNTNVPLGGTVADFDEMFWWCRGHMMTAVDVVGYNIAWFAPRPYFTDISRVCWDVNLTQMSSRKWTQVLFVSETDATAHPSQRGSGGYDLGYTNPMFRGQPGTPSAEILPVAGDLAGLQVLNNGHFRWFENQDHWTTDQNSSQPVMGSTDKATRYTHCVEQLDPGTIRFTQERPASHGGFQQVDVPGTIPRGPVRVVFQDDNYNAPKGEHYDPNVLTWHWDNIVVETGERIDIPRGPSTRMLDTRQGSSHVTADGQFQHTGKITPGSPLEVTIAGRNGVPGSAGAAYLNVTATEPDGAGHLTVYPCGPLPFASTVNYNRAGQTVADLALTDLSSRGTVCIAASTATHVVIDSSGEAPQGAPVSMTPIRMLDTRFGSSNVTADGQFQHTGAVVPGQPLEVTIAGRNGVPGGADAAFLNVTATASDGPGYLTAYPCGPRPLASTVNYTFAGQTVANLALTDLSSRGTVCIAASTPTHVVIDASGYAPSGTPTSITPVRMLDTRFGPADVTADGRFQHTGKVEPGRPLELTIANRNGVPGGATAAFLNVTATAPDGAGYLTVYPCGAIPFSSTVNFTDAGQTVANLAYTDLSPQGTVCIAASRSTHVVIDATGYR